MSLTPWSFTGCNVTNFDEMSSLCIHSHFVKDKIVFQIPQYFLVKDFLCIKCNKIPAKPEKGRGLKRTLEIKSQASTPLFLCSEAQNFLLSVDYSSSFGESR